MRGQLGVSPAKGCAEQVRAAAGVARPGGGRPECRGMGLGRDGGRAGTGVRRAVREAGVMGAVVVVVLLCAVVVGAALVAPWVVGVGESRDSVCLGEAPREVLDDWVATGSEGSLGTVSPSWLPYGPRCTWQLSDGSMVSRDPSWEATLVALGASGVAAVALVVLVRSARRSGTGARPDGEGRTP